MAEVLNAYAEEAGKKQSGGLFADPTTSGDVLNVARRSAQVTPDQAPEGIPGSAPSMGAGVREGGAAAPGPAAPGGGPATGAGGNVATETGNVSALADTNRVRLSQALGLAPDDLTPKAMTDRVLALASGKGEDVTSLLKAKQVVGDETWSRVTADVMARMGDDAGKLDLGRMLSAYGGMSANARTAVFGADKSRLDNLLTVMPKLDRLHDLSSSKLESIPILGTILKNRTAATMGVGAIIHPLVALKAVMAQVPAHLAARAISKPAVARDLTRWINATAGAVDKQGAGPMLNLTVRGLANSLSDEIGGDPADLEAQLKGER